MGMDQEVVFGFFPSLGTLSEEPLIMKIIGVIEDEVGEPDYYLSVNPEYPETYPARFFNSPTLFIYPP